MKTNYVIAVIALAALAIAVAVLYAQAAAPPAAQPAPPEVQPGLPNATPPAAAPPGVPVANITNVTTPSGPELPPPPPPPPILPITPPAINETNETGNVTAPPLVLPGGTTVVPNASAPSATEVEMNAWNFGFSPANITVSKGALVRLKIFNQGGTHSMNMGAPYNIFMDLPALQTTTVEFTASESGTFEFWCGTPTHRDLGMNGTLTVVG